MNIKTFLLGSVATALLASNAYAASPVIAVPDAGKELRSCDAYEAGYFYIPGTETCLKFSGSVYSDLTAGDNVDTFQLGKKQKDADVWDELNNSTYGAAINFKLSASTASETELGTLRSTGTISYKYANGDSNGKAASVSSAYLSLGGLRIGYAGTNFNDWVGGYGAVINDGNITPNDGPKTIYAAYTFNAGNGFSALIGAEQGLKYSDDKWGSITDEEGHVKHYATVNDVLEKNYAGADDTIGGINKDNVPNIVGGLKFTQGWGGLAASAVYESDIAKWAGKLRADLNVNDQFNVWLMGGYKSSKDYYVAEEPLSPIGALDLAYRVPQSAYATWGGSWAVWGGSTLKATPKANVNVQLSYDEKQTFSAVAGVDYTLVKDLVITPEIAYTAWNDSFSLTATEGTVEYSLKGKTAFKGQLRISRKF